jgi:hypothetical protein
MNQKEFVKETGDWIVRATTVEGVAPGSSDHFSCGCNKPQLVVSGMLVTVEKKTH